MGDHVEGYVRKMVNGDGQVTGWAAYIGEPGNAEYETDFNSAREAKERVERRLGRPVRWQRPEAGYYEAVMS